MHPVHALLAAALSSAHIPMRGALDTPKGALRAAAPPNTDVSVIPGVVPTAPGPSDKFQEGGNCTFTWIPDTSGTWNETNVQLMSGSNSAMVHVTTVLTFDGTNQSLTSYSYPCPDVEPNSAIYFYQFSTKAAPQNLTWTTRTLIAAADGKTTEPANKTQPNGDDIPWGVGALVDQSKVVAPPTYLGQPNPGTNTTTTSTNPTPTDTPTSTSTSTNLPSNTDAPVSNPTEVITSTVTRTGGDPDSTSGAGGAGGNSNGASHAQVNLTLGAVAMSLVAVILGVLS